MNTQSIYFTCTFNQQRKMANAPIYSAVANTITSYIKNVSTMNKTTAYHYFSRLKDFKNFIADEYDSRSGIDNLLLKIKKGDEDPYNLLNGYAAYMKMYCDSKEYCNV